MIVITGAAGFIASNLTFEFDNQGENRIVMVDQFNNVGKNKNIATLKNVSRIDRDHFFKWLNDNHKKVSFIFHLGARTDTSEFNREVFDRLNLGYSKTVWELCAKYQIPLLYASSAATYGAGESGYRDDHLLITGLKPLNPYGESKNEFDKWVLKQQDHPPFWAGLKFFNVYGPNEYHKGRMASVILHAYRQISSTGVMKLFRSHREGIADGEQKRDFIHVLDVVRVMRFMYINKPASGIYNVGTGHARSFLDLTHATFQAMEKEPVIEFIDTPLDIRDKYQYFTEAKMDKLIHAGYKEGFLSLEEGVADYVKHYLMHNRYR